MFSVLLWESALFFFVQNALKHKSQSEIEYEAFKVATKKVKYFHRSHCCCISDERENEGKNRKKCVTPNRKQIFIKYLPFSICKVARRLYHIYKNDNFYQTNMKRNIHTNPGIFVRSISVASSHLLAFIQWKGSLHVVRENYSSGMHVTISSGCCVCVCFSFSASLKFFCSLFILFFLSVRCLLGFYHIWIFGCNSIQNK